MVRQVSLQLHWLRRVASRFANLKCNLGNALRSPTSQKPGEQVDKLEKQLLAEKVERKACEQQIHVLRAQLKEEKSFGTNQSQLLKEAQHLFQVPASRVSTDVHAT